MPAGERGVQLEQKPIKSLYAVDGLYLKCRQKKKKKIRHCRPDRATVSGFRKRIRESENSKRFRRHDEYNSYYRSSDATRDRVREEYCYSKSIKRVSITSRARVLRD